jgi:hypothetical protein
MTVRKFLKVVGITAQHEKAASGASNAGRVHGDQGRNAKMTLEIAALGLTHLVEGVKDLVPGSGGVHHQQIGADAAIWPEAGRSSGSRRLNGSP